MKRTLYLYEAKGMTVRVDGPSLWIEQKGKAGKRVPLQMIDRVVIVGNLRVDTAVLSHLSAENLPVTIFTKNGKNISMLVSYDDSYPRYYHRQKVFYMSPLNEERFRNIVRHWRRRIQVSALKRFSDGLYETFRENNLKDRAFQRIIEFETLFYKDRYRMVYRIVYGMFCQLILSVLTQSGLDPSLGVIHRRHPHGLVHDIAYMLEAEVQILALQFFRARAAHTGITSIGVTTDGMRDIALRFENRKKAIWGITNMIIDNIIEAIKELEARARLMRRRPHHEDKLSFLL